MASATPPRGEENPSPGPSEALSAGQLDLSRRSFLAGAGALGLAPIAAWRGLADHFGVTTPASSRLGRSRASSPARLAALNVRDLGAAGDGTTDDSAALQHALDSSSAVYLPYTPHGYRVTRTLHPRSDQTLYAEGYLLAGSDAVVVDYAGVRNATVVGSLWISDPKRHTAGQPVLRFRAQCRFLSIERIWTEGCANSVELSDINESRFGEIHCTKVRDTGIRITNAPVCNVHDNVFEAITITGAPGSRNGIVFDSALNGTIGGNRFESTTVLAMGKDGLLVENTGFGEQWFGTLICDSCGGDGVHLYGGTYRFFFGQLWCSSNQSNGFYANGASPEASVSDVLINQLYAHNNAGAAGFFLDGFCERITLGTLYSLNQPGGAGVRFQKSTKGLQVANLVTYGNGIGLTDGGDPSSTGIQIGLANLADGVSINSAEVTILSTV
jgi:hypothetical protein